MTIVDDIIYADNPVVLPVRASFDRHFLLKSSELFSWIFRFLSLLSVISASTTEAEI